MAQRVEVEKQNASLRGELAEKGLALNEVDPTPVRAMLSQSSFHRQWEGRFGSEGRGLLEEYTRPSA